MIDSLTISDPISALMLAHLRVDQEGRAYAGRRRALRRRQRRFQQQARLRRLLA